MDNDFSGEITLRSSGEEARLPDIPRPILQAIHQTIVGAQETMSRRAVRNFVCDANDIAQLYHLLNQWVEPYGVLSAASKLNCKMRPSGNSSAKQLLGYKDLDSFLNRHVAITDRTQEVYVVFDVVLKAAESSKVDRLTLSVELKGASQSYLHRDTTESKIEDDIEDDLDYESHYPSQNSNVDISCRYTNYLVAKGLVDLVEDWAENLDRVPMIKRSKLSNFLARGMSIQVTPVKILYQYIPVTLAAIFFLGVSSNSSSRELLRMTDVSTALAIAVLFYSAVALGMPILGYYLTRANVYHVRHLRLSSGDKKAMDLHKNKVEKYEKRRDFLAKGIVAAFIVSVLASLSVNFL